MLNIIHRLTTNAKFLAPLVAAAGVIAGGMAAHALGADKGLVAPKGGGITGLTSSTGAGKHGNGAGYAVQVDPSISLDYFKQAATAQAAGYDQGLDYYATAIDKASQDIKVGYQQANSTLQPMSYAAGQALNQQLRMLGMDPLPATSGFSGALTTGYGAVKDAIPEASGFVSGIAQQMDAAQGIKDPDARAAAIASLQSNIASGSAGLRGTAKQYSQGITDLGNTYAQNYSANYDSGYTGDQIANVVSNLPGYQFQLSQGTQALDRSATAKGMLNSANTDLAVQNFGQQQGMGYYNQYMNYLAGVQQEGAPATMQTSANQSAQGTALATLAQNYGSAQMQSEQGKANFAGQMLSNAAQLFNQDSLFNAQAQNTSINQANAQNAALAQQAVSSGAGYMNAQTSFNGQQLQNANSVQSAQGYYNTMNSGSNKTYTMGGVSYPNYSV